MKKVYLVAMLSLLFATVSFAQEEGATTVKKPSWSGFVTNKFWDNWEISVDGGTGTAFTNKPDYGAKKDRFGWNVELSVTKWIHPVFGVRAAASYNEYSNFNKGDRFKTIWGAWWAHADAMLNFSNWVGGYREDRVYYAIPYVSAGFYGKSIHENRSLGLGVGLLNKFRVCKQIDINLELAAIGSTSRVSPVNFSSHVLCTTTAQVGITYRFNKRYWQRGAAGYTLSDIQALKDQLAASQAAAEKALADNDKLKGSLADCDKRAAAAEKKAADEAAELKRLADALADCQKKLGEEDVVIYFGYGIASLNDNDKTRLNVLAENIKNSDGTYTVYGYADKGTGTSAANTKLAEKRAKTVYDYLVKCGVATDKLSYKGTFSDELYTGKVEANRAAAIK